MTKVLPLEDRLIVIPDPEIEIPERYTEGGVLLPAETKPRPLTGTVEYSGVGSVVDGHFKPNQLVAGARIMYGKYTGTTIEIDGEERVIMREGDVYARIWDSEPVEPVELSVVGGDAEVVGA